MKNKCGIGKTSAVKDLEGTNLTGCSMESRQTTIETS